MNVFFALKESKLFILIQEKEAGRGSCTLDNRHSGLSGRWQLFIKPLTAFGSYSLMYRFSSKGISVAYKRIILF